MRIALDDGDRLVLSGPPGGRGAVVLLLVVGTAMSGVGGLFLKIGIGNQAMSMAVLGGVALLAGVAMLVGFVGVALTRDRLELDRVTRRGTWTRRLCGRFIKPPIDFDFEHAKHVTIDFFTESSPRPSGGGSTTVEKVRACLLVTKPRRRIVLDEAERQRVSRVRETARAVATLLELDLEDADA